MSQPPARKESNGTTTMPNGSRRTWGTGLSETCPPRAAVSSPSFSALHAWAASWQTVEKRNTPYHIKPFTRSGVIGARYPATRIGEENTDNGERSLGGAVGKRYACEHEPNPAPCRCDPGSRPCGLLYGAGDRPFRLHYSHGRRGGGRRRSVRRHQVEGEIVDGPD